MKKQHLYNNFSNVLRALNYVLGHLNEAHQCNQSRKVGLESYQMEP